MKTAVDRIEKGICGCCHRDNPEPQKKRAAITEANKVKRKLEKAFPHLGWGISIWHNINWCWAVRGAESRIYLYRSHFDGYHTLFNPEGGGGGNPSFSTNNAGTDPVEVVRKQLVFAKKVLIENIAASKKALNAIL